MKNKKMVLEIILIPLCLAYILYIVLQNYQTTSHVIGLIILFITSLEFIIKYFKEVYIYTHKYNYLKIIFGIFNIVLLLITTLNLIYNNNILNIIFIIGTIILLIYLLVFGTIKLKKVLKDEKPLSKNVLSSFLSYIALAIILICLVMI